MATVLADKQATPQEASAPPTGSAPPLPGAGGPAQLDAAPRVCAKCSAPLAPGQDWCLQCGAGAPGSVGSSGLHGLTAVLAATVLIVLGAAAAGYAALSKKAKRAPTVTTTVAQVTPPSTVPSTTLPPTSSTSTVSPPKIPLQAVTPTSSTTTPTTSSTTTTTPTTTTKTTSTGQTGGSSSETQSTALLLDTNAASTYNPYGLPATEFGDPSLTIDGDTSTAWTAAVNPTNAPKLEAGVLIDLKEPRKLASLKLVTSTPGITVQVFGTKAKTAPESITDPAWVALSHSLTVRKRHAKIGLRNKKQAYTLVLVWISKAPGSAVGTPEAPGHVSVNELELFPVA